MKSYDAQQAKAEIIAIGDEILFGQITNTNAQYMSEALDAIGIRVVQHTAIGDSKAEIVAALDAAHNRADIILITGGLGPTKDDLTKYTLAEYFNSPLEINEVALAHISALVQKRGRSMNELNRLQALQPTKAKYIKNEVGTAPSMLFESGNNQVVISMPGVPFEMKYIMQHEVLPLLNHKYASTTTVHYYIKTSGIGESNIAMLIADWEDALPEDVSLAYLPSYGNVRLRLTTTSINPEVAYFELQSLATQVLPDLGQYVYHHGEDLNLEQLVVKELLERKLTLSVAESCTGGTLAAMFTAMAGASAYLQMAMVPYQVSMKVKFLDIPLEFINTYGVVSTQVAEAMAKGVALASNSDIGISTTGIAGPDNGGINKPVGTICLGIYCKGQLFSQEFTFGNQRETNISLANNNLLRLLLIHLKALPK